MAVAYKGQGTSAATETNGAALQPSCPATVDSGDILIAFVGYEGTSNAPSTPANWTLIDGPRNVGSASAVARVWTFGKIAAGTEDGAAVSFGTAGGTSMRGAQIWSFSGRTSGTIEELTANWASTLGDADPAHPPVATTMPGALAVALTYQNDNNALELFAGATGGSWASPTEAGHAYALAPGLVIQMQYATPTADPGGIVDGAMTVFNDPWVVVALQILPSPDSGVPVRIDGGEDCAYPETSNFIGPFVDGNGNLYTVFERPGASTAPTPGVYKSTDSGATWTQQDSADAPPWSTWGDLESLWVAQGSGVLHMLNQRDASNGVEFYEFYTSDNGSTPDNWNTTRTRLSATGSATQACSLVRRSDGDLIAFYQQTGTNQRIAYQIKPSGGAWGGEQYIAVSSVDLSQPVAVLAANDVTRIFVVDTTNDDILMYTLSAADTLTGPTTVSTNCLASSITGFYAPMASPAVYWNSGGNECVYVAWMSSTSTLIGNLITNGTPGSNETIYSSTVRSNPGATDSQQPVATLAVYGGKVQAVYSDSATADLWSVERSTGGSWGSPVELRNYITTDYVSANAVVLGGTPYIGIILSDNSAGATDGWPSWKSYEITAAPQTISGGVASENDSATAGTKIQPQAPVAGGIVSESDSAPGGTVLQSQPPVAAGTAAEADTALAGTAGQSQTVFGGRALETDLPSPLEVTGFPGIGYGRSFDDIDDEITCAIGSAGVTGAFTIAALVRVRSPGELQPIFGMYDAANVSQLTMELNASAQPCVRVANTLRTTESAASEGSLYMQDQWAIVAVAKAAGTAEPSFHVWKQGTGAWNHAGTFFDMTVGNPGASTYVRFGRFGATAIYGEIDLGVAAVWNVELTSVQIEELAGGTTQDWLDQSGGTPVALWEFDQESVGTDVLDVVGAADQTAIVGTSIGQGPANPAWTYLQAQTISGGVASETDTAAAGTIVQPQTIEAGVVSESDSAPGGTALNPVTISGSVASENDTATSATVLQGFFRRWDGIDGRLMVTNGEALLWDNLTMAALVRKGRDGQEEWIVTNVEWGAGWPCISLGFNAANQITLRYGYPGTQRKTTTNTVTVSDGWVIVAVTKAGGTSTPRAHIWKQGSGWAHENLDGTLGDPPSQYDGYVEFSSPGQVVGETIGYSKLDLETAGEWQYNLTDGQVEELSANWGTLDWFDHSVAVPCGLWNFNQPTIGNPPDDTGIRDLSGGEAGPAGRVEGGVSVELGAPVRESDEKVWNPFTPLVGEKAHESSGNRYDGWASVRGKVLQTFDTAHEDESVPVGTVISSATFERSASVDATSSITSAPQRGLQRAAAISAAGSVDSAATSFSVLERSVSASASTIVTTNHLRELSRTAAVSASSGIGTSGAVVHVYERSSASSAVSDVAALFQRDLVRQTELDATSSVSSSGVVIHVYQRSSDVSASTSVTSVPQRVLFRSAAMAAASDIFVSSSTGDVYTGSASFSAQSDIQALHQRVLLRTTAAAAASSISSIPQRDLVRSSTLSNSSNVEAQAIFWSTLSRSVDISNTAEVIANHQRELNRQTELISITDIVTAAAQFQIYDRAGSLDAASLIESTHQREFFRASDIAATSIIDVNNSHPPQIAMII